MEINLERLFFTAFTAIALVFALLCFFKKYIKPKPLAYIADILRYACIQSFLSLAFLAVYVLYVKNGRTPRLSDIGVAMLPFSVLVFWAAWRFSALMPKRISLLYPLGYSLFLLWRFFSSSGGGVKFFGYVILNPVYGFIGSSLLESGLRPLAAVSALLPFACAAIGYGLGIKGIDKQQKI